MRSDPAGPETREMFRVCEEIAREHGRTFYLASRFLRRSQRHGVLAAYAFCRIADDIVDAAPLHGERETLVKLDAWEAQIEHPVHPVAIAFREIRDQYGISAQPVHDLLTGMHMDLAIRRYATWEDLRVYCYHVAGTVGLMVAPVLGCRDSGALVHAVDLGIAMQLTNILRDVREDATMDRLYLPLDEIERFGCNPMDILAGQPGDGFGDLMAFQIARARRLYADARCGIPALDTFGRITTLTASDLYARILDRIEAQQYDVFASRAHCSTTRKLFAMPVIAATFWKLSLRPELPVAFAAPRSVEDYRSERRSYG
jgi:phytoene synthase